MNDDSQMLTRVVEEIEEDINKQSDSRRVKSELCLIYYARKTHGRMLSANCTIRRGRTWSRYRFWSRLVLGCERARARSALRAIERVITIVMACHVVLRSFFRRFVRDDQQ